MSPSTNTSNQKSKETAVKTLEMFIGPKTKVTVDPKSKTNVVNFPFDFQDGEKGVIIICRLTDEKWIPATDIDRVVIVFK